MTTIIILNVLGIILFYLNRFEKRTVKTNFNFNFWTRENLPELLTTLVLNAAFLIILMQPETDILGYAREVLPKGLNVAVPHLTSLLLGMGLSWIIYKVINKWINKLIQKWIE